MRNRVLEATIKNAKKNMYAQEKREDLDGICSYINIVNEFCKIARKTDPNISGEQLHYAILTYMQKISEEYCKKASMRGMLFELEAVNRLLQDKDRIKKVYEKSKNIQYDPNFIYTANMDRCDTGVMVLTIKQVEENMSFVKQFDQKTLEIIKRYCMADKGGKAKLRSQYSDTIDLKAIEQFKDIIFTDNYMKKLENQLKIEKEDWEKAVKEQQTEVIAFIGEFLQDFGIVSRTTATHNRKMQDITKADLSYENSTGEYDEEKMGVKELFSKEFLEKQDFETIMAISSFWQNRFAKECDSINKALFVISNCNLWDDLAKGNRPNINSEDLVGVYKKERTVKKIVAQLFAYFQSKIDRNNLSEEEIKQGYAQIDPEEPISQYCEQEGKNYREIFDVLLPDAENDLRDDINEYRVLMNNVESIYKVKDSMLMHMLLDLFNSKRTRNWGIIQENEDVKDMILVGIDYEGLNMPLRLHLDRKNLIDTLRLRNGSTLIPLYEGSSDFTRRIKNTKTDKNGNTQEDYQNEIIKTSILMPIKKRHKKSIKTRIKELREKRSNIEELNFLEHLQFLADKDKYPEHLKINGRRPPRKYINLETYDIFIKDGENFVLQNTGRDVK